MQQVSRLADRSRILEFAGRVPAIAVTAAALLALPGGCTEEFVAEADVVVAGETVEAVETVATPANSGASPASASSPSVAAEPPPGSGTVPTAEPPPPLTTNLRTAGTPVLFTGSLSGSDRQLLLGYPDLLSSDTFDAIVEMDGDRPLRIAMPGFATDPDLVYGIQLAGESIPFSGTIDIEDRLADAEYEQQVTTIRADYDASGFHVELFVDSHWAIGSMTEIGTASHVVTGAWRGDGSLDLTIATHHIVDMGAMGTPIFNAEQIYQLSGLLTVALDN